MSSIMSEAATESARRARLIGMLKEGFAEMSGVTAARVDASTPFFEMGADSLFLLRASNGIQDRFGVRVPFRMMFEEVSTIEALADYIDQNLPPEPEPAAVSAPPAPPAAPVAPPAVEVSAAVEVTAAPAAAHAPPAESTPAATPASASALDQLLARQLEIMSKQLDVLRGVQAGRPTAPAPTAGPDEPAPAPESPAPTAAGAPAAAPQVVPPPAAAPPAAVPSDAARLVPYQSFKIEKQNAFGLSERQQEHIGGLIARVNERTKESKRLSASARRALADNRATAGFHPLWKEMQYPLMSERAAGARLWDVDGNEYVDLTMGFGALLFGHSPPFLVEALQEQLASGMQLGASSPLGGEVAELISELTGVERVAFCNSGTEAVMSALRVARCVTGRSRVALFEGCYHGTFDGVMVRPERAASGELRAGPAAHGVPQHMVDNVLMLRFDESETLDRLAAHAHELAAILIEPIPNRAPHLDLGAFLGRLREIADASGAALIFDEVVTGFRFHPAGAQGLYGIRPDLVTYGKSLGGGLPIGVVAGRAEYMDAIDGGMWSYGDRSYPRAEMTFYAGTFFKHPFTMRALRATLQHMKEAGPQLQEGLNERATRLVARLNEHFTRAGLPVRAASRASLFRFFFGREVKFPDLFYFHMLEKGVYISETRGCFVSTAHTDEDLEHVRRAVEESLEEMRRGGLLPGPPEAGAGGPSPSAGAAPGAAVGGAGEALTAPLTAAQRDLWALTQLGAEASRAYHESVTLRLRGALRAEVMERALREVVARHDALRTTFSPDGSCQRVAPSVEVELPSKDFSHLGPGGREEGARAWLAAEAALPFDLAAGPLMRARLARLGDEEHQLVLTLHHLITDGRSSGILFREVAALYTAGCAGTACRLPARPQFTDYALRQSEAAASPAAAAAEDYWRGRLAGAPTALELPTDRPRPPVRTFAGAGERVVVGDALAGALRRLSRQQGGTLFATLLAGFNALLHRLSGQADIVVGFSSSGQPAGGEADFVGFTVNLLPLRSRVEGGPSFADYLKALRGDLLDALEHQHYPFSRLLKALDLKGDMSRPPLVSAVFNLDRLGSLPGFGGLEVEVSAGPSASAKFDLFLNVSESGGGPLTLDWEYNTDLFDAQTIRRWAGHFQTLLESAASDPARGVGELPLITEAERYELLVGWNDSEARPAPPACLHRLFEEQAALAPDRTALTFEGGHMTYGELDRRAGRLAARLRALGVGPESLVGMYVEPSPEMAVGILGILKAGGAYVPLDPLYPAERLEFMLRDARIGVLVTQRGLAGKLPGCAARVLCVEDAAGEAGAAAGGRGGAVPENVSYCIYTSGSTGRPKGVLVTHQNVARIFAATRDAFEPGDGDVWSLFHSYAFDFSVWEFWGALLHGGRLAVAPYWVRRSPESFRRFLREEQVTVLNQTPSAFRQLVNFEESTSPRDALALRLVIFGGEALELQSLRPWFRRHGAQTPRLVNMYGITETTIHVTLRPLSPADTAAGGSLIGRPLSDLQVYLLDGRSQPAAVGVAGEIHVGGAGLARGYLNRPGLTAERFVPNPHARRSGARLYKSGDLARFVAGGDVEFLGRADQQVKVRGYRIEPGEVEAALAAHASVAEAAVVAREDGAGEKRLVAYVVGARGGAADAGELRRFLQQSLPQHMIPAAFVALDALPLTAHGKVDRGALPDPGPARPELGGHFVAPLTKSERQLAAVWSEVLGVEQVGVHDNFFELGGDSILAIQVTAKANEAGLRLTPRQVFQLQTVAELAAAVGAAPALQAEQGAVTGPAPLTPIQRWFLEADPVDPHHFNQAVMLELPSGQDPAAWGRIIRHLVEHHDALRLRFERAEGGWRQRVAEAGGETPFSYLNLCGVAPEERARVLADEAARLQSSLDLARGPLARAALFELGDEAGCRLLVVVHHLAVDAVSWRVVVEDLRTAYGRSQGGAELRLPPKTTSFKHWAERLVAHVREGGHAGELEYWLAEGREAGARLPLDFPGGDNSTASTRRVSRSLDREETAALLHEAPKAYHTQIGDVLLTALGQTFARWVGGGALLVGLEGHGREPLFDDVDLSRTVGWFTSIYPLRLELDEGGGAPGEALKRTKEKMRAVPQGGIGYGLLRHLSDDPAVRGALAALPVPEVVFNYLGQFGQPNRRGAAETGAGPAAAPPARPAVRMAREATGPTRSPRADRGHLIEVGGSVAGGRLTMHWSYSRNLHSRETVERLAEQFNESLRALVAHCRAPEAGGYTPSDFPHMDFSQAELDRLVAELSREGDPR